MYRARPLAERFAEHVDSSGGPDACWPWHGSHDRQGYGLIRADGGKRNLRATRVAWELEHGPIPPDMMMCHHCDNPPCVNTRHLFPAPTVDNVRDKIAKRRDPRGATHGRATHPERTARGERHGRAKLTAQQVQEIRDQRANGSSYDALAPRYGLNKSTIARICRGQYWSHI